MPNREKTQEMLGLACAMWDDSLVYCYQNLEPVPDDMLSIFLAGPSSRDDVLNFKWRPYARHYLREAGFQGIIIVPEPRNDDWSFKETFPTEIVEWETTRLLQVTLGFIWIPRHPVQLPGRVTNTESGFLAGMAYANPERFKERMIWGYPTDAWKVKSEHHWICNVAGIKPFHDLKTLCEHAHARLQEK